MRVGLEDAGAALERALSRAGIGLGWQAHLARYRAAGAPDARSADQLAVDRAGERALS